MMLIRRKTYLWLIVFCFAAIFFLLPKPDEPVDYVIRQGAGAGHPKPPMAPQEPQEQQQQQDEVPIHSVQCRFQQNQQTVQESPKGHREPGGCLYAYRDGCSKTRIQEQLDFVPKDHDGAAANETRSATKRILLYNGVVGWEAPVYAPESIFKQKQCKVDNCAIFFDSSQWRTADAVLFRNAFTGFSGIGRRPASQIWILYLLESPYHTAVTDWTVFNWTASYRLEATLVTPYGWWRPVDPPPVQAKRDYARGKSKMVAWFASNCNAANGRLELVRELQKYVPVDIFGACGTMKCPKGSDHCSEMLNTEYKFYLALENSNCRDYVTEKFYETALGNDVVPIVMGPPRVDYERVAPPHSFIHVEDFPTVRELALYLLKLNQSDHLYNEYLQWKGHYVSDDTKFWCRLCALLHDVDGEDAVKTQSDVQRRPPPARIPKDLQHWWNGPDVCIGSDHWCL